MNILNSTPRLAGQRVLVTGGGRGIGRAIAHICALEGAQVAICSRTKSDLEETSSTLFASLSPLDAAVSSSCPEMEIYVTDLTKEEEVEFMVSSIVQKWGGIDILINNAGKGQAVKGPAHTLKAQDLASLLDVNIVAVHTVTSAVLRHSMLKNLGFSRILNVSSRGGKIGIPNNSFYTASKFALEGYSASLAQELKDHNIAVNTISPGMVNTRSFPKPEKRKGVRTAESIKDGLLVFLGHNITGHYLHVDELDQVREKGLDDSVALKPIDEATFLV